jgi:hypothetical protein
LLDLESFDVGDGHDEAEGRHDHEGADAALDGQVATKGVRGDDDGADSADQSENGDQPAIDAVEEQGFAAYYGDELEDSKNRRGCSKQSRLSTRVLIRQRAKILRLTKYGAQMEYDAKLVKQELGVPIAFARSRCGSFSFAENSIEVQISQTGQGEA